MDMFRLILCLGLGVLLWRAQVRGVRPVPSFSSGAWTIRSSS